MRLQKFDYEIRRIAESCRIVVETLNLIKKFIRAGISTGELNKIAEDYILSQGGTPSFKGYLGYPAAICTSVNEEVVHGIPGKRVLKDGDIISLDVGVYKNRYHGDAAVTFPVGEIDGELKKLLETTKKALSNGIEQAMAGNRLKDISWAIQKTAEQAGFAVVRDLVGHGIGKEMHEEPKIPNFGVPGTGMRLKPGMVLAIEPMFNLKNYRILTKKDNWTVITEDGLPSSHFEHTIVVNNDEPTILTGLLET
jgi:methionyl aminopeptidase